METTPRTNPPKGACAYLGIPNPLSACDVLQKLAKSVALFETPLNKIAVAPQRSPSGKYNGNSAKVKSSKGGTSKLGDSPNIKFVTVPAKTAATMTISVVDALLNC
jgi:hypothetical protein